MNISLKFKEFSKLRPNQWLLGLLILIPIIGIGYLTYNQFVVVPQQQAKRNVQTALVERSNLPITVSANGTVQPEQSVNVSPKTSGILKQLLVEEGDSVKQGQVLAYMDASNLQGQLHQAQGNLAAAQANLQRMKAGNRQQDIAQAKALLHGFQFALRQTEDDLQRNQPLYQAGAISKQAFNIVLTARDHAQAQVKQYQEALALSQVGSRPEDIEQARAQVAAAQGAVQIIQANLNDTVIRAPFSGIVARKFADPGSLMVGAIAGISLVVGGIGIANIMLVSVMERTREIGIRKAVGATSTDILSQFLTEAIVISTVGGVIGVGLGIALAFSAATLFKFPFIVPLWSIGVGFGLSFIVGILAGGIPARNAAKLDPISALHNE